MKYGKRILAAALLLLLISLPAAAATKLPKYALVANRQEVSLSQGTGYLYRSGSKLMIPIERVCDALSLRYTVNAARKIMKIERADGVEVEIRVDSKTALVGGKKKALRLKTARQSGQKIAADIELLKYLNASFKHYKPGKASAALGYKDGALAVALAGGSLALPEQAQPEAPGDLDALPEEAREAAKAASQILTVEHKSGSKATLTYYQKRGGSWAAQFSTPAYVGKKGIDKQEEGDKRTPTGTFNLTTPFGIKADPGTKMGRYTKVTKNHYWSGQSGSKYYNQLVDVSKVDYKPNFKDERLINYAGVYNYGLFIDYNKEGKAGKGSCIFLHCMGSNSYTAGCIAIKQDVMIELLRVLNGGAKIVIY